MDRTANRPFVAPVDRARIRETITFLTALLHAPGEAVAVDQDAARRAIAATLALKEPLSPMKSELYEVFTLHGTNIAVEGVCFRTRAGRVEILLLQRGEEDPYHRGCYAGPGKVIRPTDGGPEDALLRLGRDEFQTPTTFEYVGDTYVTRGMRGWFECKVYLAHPEGEPAIGTWFPTDPLPPESAEFQMVPSHREQIIPLALARYTRPSGD